MSSETRYPSDEADRFQVRMPPGLRSRIAAQAKANGRSMNSEIIARLEMSLEIDLDAYRRDTDRLEELLRRQQSTQETMQGLLKLLEEATTRLAKQGSKA